MIKLEKLLQIMVGWFFILLFTYHKSLFLLTMYTSLNKSKDFSYTSESWEKIYIQYMVILTYNGWLATKNTVTK